MKQGFTIEVETDDKITYSVRVKYWRRGKNPQVKILGKGEYQGYQDAWKAIMQIAAKMLTGSNSITQIQITAEGGEEMLMEIHGGNA